MKNFIVAFVVAVGLGACAATERRDVFADLENSRAVFQTCIAAAGAKSSTCEGARLNYRRALFEARTTLILTAWTRI